MKYHSSLKIWFKKSTLFLNKKRFSDKSSPTRIDMFNSVLSDLDILLNKPNDHNYKDIQIEIEKFVFNQFYQWSLNKPSNIVLKINLDKLTPKFRDVILDSMKSLTVYLQQLNKNLEYEVNKKKKSSVDNDMVIIKMYDLFNVINKDEVKQYIISYYLRLITDIDMTIDSDDGYESENIYLTSVIINIGSDITKMYYRKLYNNYLKNVRYENKVLSYSEWFNHLNDQDKYYYSNSKFYANLGGKIVDIMQTLNLVSINVINKSKIEKVSIIEIPESIKVLLNEKKKIYSVPTRLPMIVPPKPYASNKLGGYLLNDVLEIDDLIIDKASYKYKSNIEKDIIYRMVNNISSTPYKINKQLLDYLDKDGEKYKILMSQDVIDKYENIENKSTYIKNKLKGFKSEYLLQENILEIATLFKNKNIYFPVRLDQRGRLYCVSHYFNYQASELAKGLLLFANAGIVKRNDEQAIKFLKIYGANCFGLDKLSHKKRLEWVDNNVEDIINYDNGKLINKAKSKVLFLSFCMEFVQFYGFICDESAVQFKTYLPIQLDATCNGFQHLALLSNEKKLFEQLNITKSPTSEEPGDLYNYILFRLDGMLRDKLKSDNLNPKLRESYERLHEFVWSRSDIKKAIMTIPYNASRRSISKYIKDSLEFLSYNSEQLDEPKYVINKLKKKVKITNKIIKWYGKEQEKNKVNSEDIDILVSIIYDIIKLEFTKISRLTQYLRNVANICNNLNVPICWSLPHGLEVKQSYLQKYTERIKVFSFSNMRLNITKSDKNKFDSNKQVIALMPNLIHSLDAASMVLLYDQFSKIYFNSINLYTVHDCFSSTAEKISNMVTILRSVYTKFYSDDPYLRKFDDGIIKIIHANYDESIDWNHKERKLTFIKNKKKRTYYLHDIEWVLGNKLYDSKHISKIDSQYLLN